MESYSSAYKDAGVDITNGYKSVNLMKEHIKRSATPNVISDIGGFAGLFNLDTNNLKTPILVSGTDGVGTKLKLAFLKNKHDTVGIDCVAMCVNDIVCTGARPLFFLDYIATGKLVPEKTAEIVKGIADGCQMSGMALIGGETAEMPGFYPENEYDLAGFAVGVVDKAKIIDGKDIEEDDVVIALASSGVHSNGFSLVRKVFDLEGDLSKYNEKLNANLLDVLIEPTKIYVKSILSLLENKDIKIKGISHITGGGFYENMPRCLPKDKGLAIEIYEYSLQIPKIFNLLEEAGNISHHDMFNTFNMGVGMIVVTDQKSSDTVLEILKNNGEKAYKIGRIIKNTEDNIDAPNVIIKQGKCNE